MKSVAVDGPSGAGKSTIVKAVAERLGFLYVDTGAIYRSIGLYAARKGILLESITDLVPFLPEINVFLTYSKGVQHIFLNDEDVSDLIRSPEMSLYASAVSAIPEVREKLLDLQRSLAVKNNVIMDGRDIGTVVLPSADVKIFLTASPEERAMRRFLELNDKGISVTFDETLADVNKRDYNDSHRKVAPLVPAADAILIDTTGRSREESIELVYEIIRERLDS